MGERSAGRGRAPLVVAVTGGMGAGKTAFCERMARHPGVVRLDADAVVHRILREDAAARSEIVGAFGPEMLDADGTLDRGRLAERAFADGALLARLEAILHPRVRRLLAGEVAALKRSADVDIVLVEIPLLAESGAPDWCDLVVTLEAPVPLRIARLVHRGVPPEAALRRIARQAGEARRRAAADIVVDNSAGPEALASAADALWREWHGRGPHPAGRKDIR